MIHTCLCFGWLHSLVFSWSLWYLSAFPLHWSRYLVFSVCLHPWLLCSPGVTIMHFIKLLTLPRCPVTATKHDSMTRPTKKQGNWAWNDHNVWIFPSSAVEDLSLGWGGGAAIAMLGLKVGDSSSSNSQPPSQTRTPSQERGHWFKWCSTEQILDNPNVFHKGQPNPLVPGDATVNLHGIWKCWKALWPPMFLCVSFILSFFLVVFLRDF